MVSFALTQTPILYIMPHLIQQTYLIEKKAGHLNTESPFPSCEIARRLTPLQKELLAESIISKYLDCMTEEIETEEQNDRAWNEIGPIKQMLIRAGINIQIIEKI